MLSLGINYIGTKYSPEARSARIRVSGPIHQIVEVRAQKKEGLRSHDWRALVSLLQVILAMLQQLVQVLETMFCSSWLPSPFTDNSSGWLSLVATRSRAH